MATGSSLIRHRCGAWNCMVTPTRMCINEWDPLRGHIELYGNPRASSLHFCPPPCPPENFQNQGAAVVKSQRCKTGLCNFGPLLMSGDLAHSCSPLVYIFQVAGWCPNPRLAASWAVLPAVHASHAEWRLSILSGWGIPVQGVVSFRSSILHVWPNWPRNKTCTHSYVYNQVATHVSFP